MERMIVMNIPYVFKRCTKCGEWLVASTYNFNKMKNGKYGLQPKCNKCRKEYRNANKEKTSKPLRFQGFLWSCWADSNCRPHPYQLP